MDGFWLRTGDLGVYLNGELYITGRIKDLRHHRRTQSLPAGHRGDGLGVLDGGTFRVRCSVLGAGQ